MRVSAIKFPMESAPRNGLSIVVGGPCVGEFVMHWSPATESPLFAPGVTGMWESSNPAQPMTWAERNGAGPTYWRKIADDQEGA